MAKRKTRTAPRQAEITDEEEGPVQGNDAIATKVWKCWRESRVHLRDWRTEAVSSFDYVAGNQWTEEERSQLKEQLRPIVTFNRTGVVIDSVSGYEINNRQDIAYLPREVDDSGPVQIESEAAKYYREGCDAEDEESDSFVDLITAGYGWIEHHMDYDDDPEGMLKVERVDPMEMGYDPASSKRNLGDRRWDIRGKWWDKDVAKATFPDHDFEASQNIAGDTEDGLDGQTPTIREDAAFYKDSGAGEQTDRRRGKVFILEHTWFEREPFTTALNPQSNKLEEADPKILKMLNERLAANGQAPLKSVKRTRKVFKRAFVHGKDTLNKDDLEAPCPHRFHYQAMTGKRDRNKNIFYGIVRAMKDPQLWANKFMSQTMHMINANAKGGLIHDAGAFDKPQEVEQKMAKPGWRLEKNAGFAVEFVPPPEIPRNTFELMQFAIGSVRDTTGVNLELLGLTDRDQPGVLEHSRKQAAMATLSPFFNSMRRYRKEAGRLTLYFIGQYMSDGRKIRIVNNGMKQYVPLTNVQDFTKYDIVVDESPSSPNVKEQVFGVMSSMIPMLIKMGVPVPPEIIDYVPGLPADLAQKWKTMLVPKGPDPQKQAAQQLELAEQKAKIDNLGADTMNKEATAAASIAKVIPLLQQVLVGLGVLGQAVPGGPDVQPPAGGPMMGAPPAGPPPEPPPEMMQGGMPQGMMPPQGMPMPEGGPMPSGPMPLTPQ